MDSTLEDNTTLCVHFCAHTSQNNASRFAHFISDKITEHRPEMLYLTVSSPGGDNVGAISMYEFLRSLIIPIITHSAGITDSSAVSIFLAGATRFATARSRFLIHKPSWTFEAKTQFQAAKLKEFVQVLERDEETHIAIITERTGAPVNKVRKWHDTGAVFSSTEALEHGIINEIREFHRPKRCLQFAN